MSACAGGRTPQAIKSIEEREGSYIATREFTYDGGKLKSVTYTVGNELLNEISVAYSDGKVSQVTETDYYTVDAERRVLYECGYHFTYNGDKPERLSFTLDVPETETYPDREWPYDFSFDGDRLVRFKYVGDDGTYQRDYEYDGDSLEELRVLNNADEDRFSYRYDEDGRINQVTRKSGSNSYRWELEFDGEGRVEEITDFDNDRWTIDYGDNGLMRSAERSFSNRVYTVEYEDFSVEGFTFIPFELVPDIVAGVMDFSGNTYAVPDLLSELISETVIEH